MSEREAAVCVATANGVGPVTAGRLRRRFGTYRRTIAAACGTAAGGADIPPKVRNALRESARPESLARQLAWARAAGARFVMAGESDYPDILGEIPRAPVGLFVKGRTLADLVPMIAVVGTRAPTPRGKTVARELAGDLARAGLAVASGLARGIDTAAHRGALEAGGTTVAVLGSGLDRLYPPENAGLADEIVARGAVVSEFGMGRDAAPGHFPQRNRIVAGLSIGVVVVEAAERSGALITAARALEEGREVFAVPGPIDEPQSRGPNGLIKAGAKLVEGIGDVLDELTDAWGPFGSTRGGAADGAPSGRPGAAMHGTRDPAGGSVGEAVTRHLTLTPLSPDELAGRTGEPISRILAVLLELEIADLARGCPGGRYVAGSALRRSEARGTRPAKPARRRR